MFACKLTRNYACQQTNSMILNKNLKINQNMLFWRCVRILQACMQPKQSYSNSNVICRFHWPILCLLLLAILAHVCLTGFRWRGSIEVHCGPYARGPVPHRCLRPRAPKAPLAREAGGTRQGTGPGAWGPQWAPIDTHLNPVKGPLPHAHYPLPLFPFFSRSDWSVREEKGDRGRGSCAEQWSTVKPWGGVRRSASGVQW